MSPLYDDSTEARDNAAFEALNRWVMYRVMLPLAVLVVVGSWVGVL